MEIARGDLVSAVLAGEYGKPRPVLIMQDDAFGSLQSLTVLPLTSDLQASPVIRIRVEPSSGNGLQKRSDIMVDKTQTVTRSKIGRRIGSLDERTMRAASSALRQFLGLDE
ncbi:MAG TPA: type II toxin-antitoxin system PemK/MazF family toxin [Stellaceae bacterium]|nr:type II toxin-antitoxin system PemK/MazF family toxin [Stellaceae bacterium]